MTINPDAGIAAFTSAVLVWPLHRTRLRWPGALAIPMAVAYFTYWIPAWWSGTDGAQYSAWAPIGIAECYLVAVLVTSTLVAFSSWRGRRSERALQRPKSERGEST